MENKLLEALSEKISPQEIKNREFKKTALGYSPREVVDFLDSIAKSWERVQKHERELIEKIRVLNEEVNRFRHQEQEIAKLREGALKEAQAIRDEGAREA